MDGRAVELPAFLLALEQSGIGQTIRQAAWLYPIANTGHILALMVFAAAVAVMDRASSVPSPRPRRHR
jgi:hypothetical protein